MVVQSTPGAGFLETGLAIVAATGTPCFRMLS
jgi:hypothetical protein